MPERSSYAPETPSWVDLGTPGVDASARFYARDPQGAAFAIIAIGATA